MNSEGLMASIDRSSSTTEPGCHDRLGKWASLAAVEERECVNTGTPKRLVSWWFPFYFGSRGATRFPFKPPFRGEF